MDIQAIAFDLDDTLLRDDASISPYTLSVLHRAAEKGIRIIPASGRTSSSMRSKVDLIGCVSCYVCCNGAEVRTPGHELLMQKHLSADLAREIAQWAEANGIYAHVYDETRFYYSKECGYAEQYQRSSSLSGCRVPDLPSYITAPTPKLLMVDTPDRIAALMMEAQDIWGQQAAITRSKPYFLEFNPPQATKGNALRWCARQLGFSMANVMAFGDSLNDLSMLEAAGHGVAMANAWAEVKARIPAVCPSNQEDGVARYIEQYILKEERP